MTQFIRPAQAYGAVAAAIANVASVGAADQRALHARIVAALGGARRGTTQYGTMRSFNTSERHIAMPDAVYSALVTAGVNFADALYNSAMAAGTYTNLSEIPLLWNPGLHRQVVFAAGDSIMNGAYGAGAHPLFNTLSNRLWAQALTQTSGLRNAFLASTVTHEPDRGYTCQWTHPRSRLVFNFGRDSWRLANIGGFTYTQGSPWLDNIQQMAGLALHASQQLVVLIEGGTNDFKYAGDNGNPGLSAVPTGTAGATYAGSPNFVTDALVPFIAAIKALYPTAKIVYQTPIARFNTGTLNGKFNELATYVLANRVALGIDVVIDTRAIPEFDCRTPAVTDDLTYYQDQTHPTPAGATLLGAAHKVALDGLL